MKRLLFSERYKDLDKDGYIIEIKNDIRDQIARIFNSFYIETIEQPNRYNSWTERSSNERSVWVDLVRIYSFNGKPNIDAQLLLNDEFFVFDAIESWNYHTKDAEFAIQINAFFEDNDLPYRLIDGKIIKLDTAQFEHDLLSKHLKELEELKTVEPQFFSAYEELSAALEAYDLGDFNTSTVKSAESYESILKIVGNKSDGQAASNIKHTLSLNLFNDFPTQINKDGFKDNVLMALPYIRNQTMVGHGKGATSLTIPKSLAKLAINLSCSLCAYYIELYRNIK